MENPGVNFGIMGDKEIRRIMADPKLISYIGMLLPARPGWQACVTRLEFEHYPPDTELNEKFLLSLIKHWDIVWAVVTIPLEDKHLMEKIAEECGLRASDGLPHMGTSRGIESFPYNGPNVFTMENVPGHPVYQNDPDVDRLMGEAEKNEVREARTKGPAGPQKH